jgi:hypothetical protein
VGLLLVGVDWGLYWSVVTVWSHALFFGLWLGYVLTVDGLVHRRTGTSMLDRGAGAFVLAFAASVPFWWVFEWCNWVTRNWSYTLPVPMGRTADILMFSLTFSTVFPALFETAELLRSTRLFRGPWQGRGLPLARVPTWCATGLGVLALVGMLLLPRQLFLFVWLFPLLILDPVNGRPSLWDQAAAGRWRLAALLAATGLVCGFFWELWNSRATGEHWQYFLPSFLSHPHLFAMPLPGYLGYPPFAASAYACYQALCARLRPLADAAPDLA